VIKEYLIKHLELYFNNIFLTFILWGSLQGLHFLFSFFM
jgi:hypothetical protein